jgi:hypothetical protein
MKNSEKWVSKKRFCRYFLIIFLISVSVTAAQNKVVVVPFFGNQIPIGPPSPVPKTGQITSYNAGDDGELQRGLTWPNPRFTDNGDGTVTDNLTGVMWTKDADLFGHRQWPQALIDCDDCTAGGYNDWHLPQRRELFSLLHDAYSNPPLSNAAGTGHWTEGDPFTNVQTASNYWSSTTLSFNSSHAWYINLNYGFVNTSNKTDTIFVWCVRDGPN